MGMSIEEWTTEIIKLGNEQKYQVFSVSLRTFDFNTNWEAWASFRHDHNVHVIEVTAMEKTAQAAIEALHNKLHEVYAAGGPKAWMKI
jgi:hypothetical protein